MITRKQVMDNIKKDVKDYFEETYATDGGINLFLTHEEFTIAYKAIIKKYGEVEVDLKGKNVVVSIYLEC